MLNLALFFFECTKSVAVVILEIGRAKESLNSDLDGMVVTMPTKFERNWDREGARKHCVQKPTEFGAYSSLQSRSFWGQ